MNRIKEIPGIKDLIVLKVEQLEELIVFHVSMPLNEHQCPQCNQYTKRVHNYRLQKIKRLKWFERLTTIL